MLCVIIRIAPSRRFWDDSNEYTQYTIFRKKKTILTYPKSAAIGFFPGTKKRVGKSRGKRAISVRATEVLLYLFISKVSLDSTICSAKCQFCVSEYVGVLYVCENYAVMYLLVEFARFRLFIST